MASIMTSCFLDLLTQATEYLENRSIKCRIQKLCPYVIRSIATVWIKSTNLSNEQMTLCQAAMTDLKYVEMVKKLKRLFADAITSTPVDAQATYQTKEEPLFYNENNNNSVIMVIPGEETGIGAMEAEIGDRTTLLNQRREALI